MTTQASIWIREACDNRYRELPAVAQSSQWVRSNAIESLPDLLTNADQYRETAARRFGHDLTNRELVRVAGAFAGRIPTEF
jgi:hypothetical protein